MFDVFYSAEHKFYVYKGFKVPFKDFLKNIFNYYNIMFDENHINYIHLDYSAERYWLNKPYNMSM